MYVIILRERKDGLDKKTSGKNVDVQTYMHGDRYVNVDPEPSTRLCRADGSCLPRLLKKRIFEKGVENGCVGMRFSAAVECASRFCVCVCVCLPVAGGVPPPGCMRRSRFQDIGAMFGSSWC